MIDDSQMNSSLRKNPIAIIGMGGIFPGATNLQEYWDNIVKEVDSITQVPPSRWLSDDYFDPDPRVPDKTYNNRGGFIPDIDFNPMEFGLPPNILEVTDASQLLSLVVATQAMRDAGYGNGREFNRARTGVTLGVGGGQKLITPLTSRLQYPIWDRVLESSGIEEDDRAIIVEKMKKAYIRWEENSFPGMLGNVISGRVANRLDLGGMNCVVDAACAASLAAIKLAVLELSDGRADMMISGGVDTDNSIFMYMSFSKTPAFSRKQIIRPFDAESDGMMIGEGVGMVVMKRLADAERDGDKIYAVIRGVGSSSDGRYKSIYAPRATGQAQAVVRAYEDAGYSHATVGLVEAHGTGTPAGDPTEFDGLNQVFSHNNPARQHIALGSVKSQIGHTKAAAGAASMIKAALALHHKILPPTLNVTRPHPKMDIENTPFYLNTHTRPWLRPTDGSPRRAGVSAFGFGGTNFHFALEEYGGEHGVGDRAEPYRLHKTAHALFLAAPSPQHLLAEATAKLAALQGADGATVYDELITASQTPNLPIASARIGFVSDSLEQAIEFLGAAIKLLRAKPQATDWEHPKGIYYRQAGIAAQGKVVALFPGQGSQYLEMGKALALNFPAIRDAYAQIDALFVADGQRPLSSVVFPVPGFTDADLQAQNNTLRRTEHVQPAIGAFSFGLYKLLQQAGFNPDFAAGHSFGELTALWAGGVLSDEAFTFLTKARGQAMAAPNNSNFDAGTMLAVKGDTAQLQRDVQGLDGVTIANFNSNEQVVLAGSKAAMAAAHKRLEPMGYVVTPLPVSAAFHTSFVGHAQRPFAQAIDRVQFSPPRIPVYGNSSGQPYANNPASIQASLKAHILNPVLFRQEIENIYAAGGAIFVEIGPKRVLTNLVKNILNGRPHVAIAVNASSKKDSDRQLREAYAQLCVAGLPLRALDPYPVPFDGRTANKHTPVNVTLGGHNYVSPKTKAAFEEALKDGHRVASGKVQVASVPPPPPPPAPKPAPKKAAPKKAAVKAVPPKAAPKPAPKKVDVKVVPPKAAVEEKKVTAVKPKQQEISMSEQRPLAQRQFQQRLEQSLAMLHEHQAETARVHEVYLQGQAAYAQGIVALMQGYEQLTINNEQLIMNERPGEASGKLQVASGQAASSNGQLADGVVAPAPVMPASEPVAPVAVVPAPAAPAPVAPVVAAPAPQPQAAAPVAPAFVAASGLSDAMLVIVSEKTGYPVEMLELDMDMEADLGIDSIKRVEILGAMQEQHPELPEVNPNELAELRTLREIVEHMGAAGTPAVAVQQAATPVAQVPVVQTAVSTPTPAATSDLSDAMLLIVSEKTGYPVEMLELDMDMEADLGIDSIKRVEILGAMQEQHPELPEVNPNELAELRTLREIVEHMGASGTGTPAVVQDPIAQEPVVQTAVSTPAPAAASDLSDAMLVIVSEKTGYPVEMLELDMDMEADLGIDSIKRVEILGAMQEQHPELPEVNPNELAELRTLREIVEHMGASGVGTPAVVQEPIAQEPVVQTAVSTPAPAATSDLSDAMLVIVSEKTGYPVEMLELDMDMEADLGIDSIKRVEILGAMQEQHPELPEVNPNELAELRTLREIVEHMQGAGAGAEKKADPAVAGAGFSTQGNSVPAPSTNHAITRNVVHLKSLPMPDFLSFAPSKTAVCLITDDGTPLTTHVVQALMGRGWKTAVLSFPPSLVPEQAALPAGVQRVALDSLDEAELQQKLGAFDAPIGSFIHLNPVVQKGGTKGIVKAVFFIAKHLKEALNGAAEDGRSAFITVAQLDGALGMDGGQAFHPINGGLFGLTKTLNLEWPRVYCRAVDLHPGIAAEQAAGYVLAELYDPNRLLVEVGYGHKGRVTLETAVTPLAPYTPSDNITPSSVFVVSGGAKGITAQCAIAVAEQYQCKFILLGRSSIADVDTSWLGEYENEAGLKRLIMNHLLATGQKPTPMAVNKIARTILSKREIEGTLNAIAQTGGQAEYVSVDVTDEAGLKRELTAVSARLGQISGLIHGAGVLSDKLIEKKTESDFEAVFSTKIHGLHALLQAIPPSQLSHLVLFSSAAGFYGNVGQADYALANEILNKKAHRVKQQYPACHVVSIDWGPWDGGMVTPALKKLFAERNIPVIPVDVGAWILANEMTEANADVAQIVVGGELAFADAEVDGGLQTHRLHRFLSVAANPFLRDHVIGGHPVLPTVCAIAWMSNACEQLYPGFTMASVEKYQVLKGIVFDDPADAPQEYILDLEETAKGDGAISFKAMVSSQDNGRPRFHYRAEITLTAKLPAAPIYADVDLSERNPIDKATLYGNGTLFHGADFQGVERVLNISPTKVTMRCSLPPQPDGEAGQFGVQSFNPFIADGQFQSMVIWARHFHDAGSLPLFTERGEQFRPIPFGETTYVSMEVRESSSSKLVADIITHGENGRVYARVLGAQVTISKQLNHLFVASGE